MTLAVRPAEGGDGAAIRAVHIAAFPTKAEADLVEALERSGDATASLVAEDRSAIVGHVLLSRMNATGDGRTLRAVGLAPVAVLPSCQGDGIGSRLVLAALEAARAAGEEIVFLVGEPHFYRRFGFSAEAASPFGSPYAGPYFMARPLDPGFEAPVSGKADYAPPFAALGEAG